MEFVTVALSTTACGFACCLVAIAYFDLRSYTIPNAISVALIWLFCVSLPFAPPGASLSSHLYSFSIVLAVGLLSFRFGVFGGGDVKSWAAIALWYDLNDVSLQLLSVTMIGGTLGLMMLGLRRFASWQFVQHCIPHSRVPRLLRSGEPIPYGVAIALGTALTTGQIDLFHSISF